MSFQASSEVVTAYPHFLPTFFDLIERGSGGLKLFVKPYTLLVLLSTVFHDSLYQKDLGVTDTNTKRRVTERTAISSVYVVTLIGSSSASC